MLVGHNPTMEEVLEGLIGADQMVAAIPGGYPPPALRCWIIAASLPARMPPG